jgi:hypothetical protein
MKVLRRAWRLLALIAVTSTLNIYDATAWHTQENDAQKPSTGEFYVSGFAIHSTPIRSTYSIDGSEIQGVSLAGNTAGGAKIGYFFPHFNSAFGAEFEVFSNDGQVTAPRTVKDGNIHFSNEKLSTTNFMFNGIARYPGDFIQPYASIGIGLSTGAIEGESQNNLGRFKGRDPLDGLAFQASLGARLLLTKHIYLFTECKYLATSLSNGDCKECSHALDFSYESFFTAFGAGLRF